jgi:hypothetical protein
MGYSTSRQTLNQMLSDLELLAEGKGCIWRVDPNEAHKFAYKVREALYIASLYPDEYPVLASARDEFVIEITSSREVQARKARGKSTASVRPFEGVNTGLEEGGLIKRLIGAHTAESIIQSWTEVQPNNDRFFFPEANLPEDDLIRLHQWAETKKLIFFVSQDGGLTLQKYDSSLDGLSWSPEDLREGYRNE